LDAAGPIDFESKANVQTIGWMDGLAVDQDENAFCVEERQEQEKNSGEEVSSYVLGAR
jgi:hypothetical protein